MPKINSYPENNYFVICDICGFKIRAKDAVRVTDKYSQHYKMVVCKKDLDVPNPQARPINPGHEKPLRSKLIRPEQTPVYRFVSDPEYIDTGNTSSIGSRLPSAPRFLSVLNADAGATDFQWMGPIDPGSGAINNHKIERESPVGGGFSLLQYTGYGSNYFKDTTTVADTEYNYRVSAVSDVGVGSVSETLVITT